MISSQIHTSHLEQETAMQAPDNLFELVSLYVKYIQETNDTKRAKTLAQEIWSSFFNAVLLGLGYEQLPSGTKQTIADREAAPAFMRTQPVSALINAQIALQKGLEKVERTQKTQDIYQRSLDKCLTWSMQQPWWSGSPSLRYTSNSAALRCPDIHQGYGSKREKRLTRRSGKTSRYGLNPREISSKLQAELSTFQTFLTQPEHPNRKTEYIAESGANNYIRELLLMLGWFCHCEGVAVENLSLSLLIPKLPRQEWKYLSKSEQIKFWKPYKQQVEAWITKYFQFLREERQSVSPHTKRGRLSALSALGKFQYCTAVDFASDYEDIPVLQVIANRMQRSYSEVAQRQHNREYVSDQELKWPDVVEGETTLTTIQKQILEPVRLTCRPKSKSNKLRTSTAIASSEQEFSAWFLIGGMPTRRQEDIRELKIALSCPVPPLYSNGEILVAKEVSHAKTPESNWLQARYSELCAEYSCVPDSAGWIAYRAPH